MRKTLFAGLTVLNPDEPVTIDNGAFINRDRDIIDRLLELGAKTHRHSGLDGLGSPVSLMGASAIASGGTIGADENFSLAYTLEDADGGETILSPVVTFSTQAAIDAPFAALAGEAVYDEGGDLPVDTYYYAFSFVDGGGGETPVGPARAVERQPGFEEAKVVLSGFQAPMASAGAAGWRLYRAIGGGDFAYLASGTTDSYVDDGSVSPNCDLTPLPDEVNTTNGDSSFEIALPSADAFVAESTFINIYMTNSGDFVGDVLLEQFPLSSAGNKVLYRSIDLLEGQPPDVNTSVGTAHKIDPDVELLDWHWKRPVANPAALPSGEKGDIRLVYSNRKLYGVFGESAAGPEDWDEITGGGTTSASGITVQNGVIVDPAEIIEFQGSGVASVNVTEPLAGKALVTIHSSATYPDVTASGVTVEEASEIEFVGSGGVTVTESEPEPDLAEVLIEGDRATLGQEGMGVIVHGSNAAKARGTKFKQYIWIGSVEPENMAEFDIWIET